LKADAGPLPSAESAGAESPLRSSVHFGSGEKSSKNLVAAFHADGCPAEFPEAEKDLAENQFSLICPHRNEQPQKL